MSAPDGSIGTDPIRSQPIPTRQVLIYEEPDKLCWPQPLRDAFDEWIRFVDVFHEHLQDLYAQPSELIINNPVVACEVAATERFIAFAEAPLEAEGNLTLPDADYANNDRIFVFAAIGPYGDPLLLKEMFEDCLTHANIPDRDFRNQVTPYMQFLARYDPRYWRPDQVIYALDYMDPLHGKLAAAVERIEHMRDEMQELEDEHQAILDAENRETEVVRRTFRVDVANRLLEITQRQGDLAIAIRGVEDIETVINAQIMVYHSIECFLASERPGRGQDAHKQLGGGGVDLGILREFP